MKKYRTYKAQKAALTRALKSGDREKILAECIRVRDIDWTRDSPHTPYFPDDWIRWERALNDSYPYPLQAPCIFQEDGKVNIPKKVTLANYSVIMDFNEDGTLPSMPFWDGKYWVASLERAKKYTYEGVDREVYFIQRMREVNKEDWS